MADITSTGAPLDSGNNAKVRVTEDLELPGDGDSARKVPRTPQISSEHAIEAPRRTETKSGRHKTAGRQNGFRFWHTI